MLLSAPAWADPLAAPGDLRLRHDLQLLNDAGIIDVPLTAWPLPLGDVHAAIKDAITTDMSEAERAVFARVHEHLDWELEDGTLRFRASAAGAANPRIIRGFESTPREEGEAQVGLQWFGERFAVNLTAAYVADPFDGDEIRPDGTYIGMALGNWLLTAGWQERWWGPSRDGSLILGTNARPTPGIMLQRNISTPFETKWLRWMGPWTLTSFMSQLDDDRVINDALLFGVRGSFRPPGTGLEIGISRTAQWCGDDRPCGLETFVDLLLGNDNQGVNVDPEDEPGNQLGGFDIRWKFPGRIPVVAYVQWIGEDSRSGGGAIGSWLRQAGVEFWGRLGDFSHRSHFEISDTMCREGGFGSSDEKPNCAYEHYIYQTGYRYKGRAIGHPIDADGRSYSIGTTLVQSGGQAWNLSVRLMEINRLGEADARHSLSGAPLDISDVQLSYETMTRFGRIHAGLAYSRSDELATGTDTSESGVFLRWSNQ
jgi:hypothetical protein